MKSDGGTAVDDGVATLDGRRVSKSITLQLLAAAIIAVGCLALPGARGSAIFPALAFAGTALMFIGWQRHAPTSDGRRLIEAGLVGGSVLVTCAAATAGADSPFLLFYGWLVPWAFIAWGRGRAGAYVALLAVTAGALLVFDRGGWPEFVRVELPLLVVGMGGTVAVGLVVRMLLDHLFDQQLAARRLANCQALVADLARRALEDVNAADALNDEAGRVLRTALRAEAAGVATAGTPPGQLHVPIGPAEKPYGLLWLERPRRAFREHEVAFARAIAEVLAVAGRRVEVEREHRDRAGHDALTGLLGRERFAVRLAEALADGAHGAHVLVIDIDDFVLINETLGPLVGDELLRAVGQRLTRAAGDGATVARFAGDEFAVLARGGSEARAVLLAKRVQRALRQPFELGEGRHHVSASVGITVCGPGTDPRVAIRDAHLAQRRAREQGRGRYEIFDSELRRRLEQRRSVEQELRRALERNEFRLMYQPAIELATGRVCGAEALIRWQHPERGLIAPGEFIEIAESSDLIVPIGSWVIREALRQLSEWGASVPAAGAFRLSINVSGRQLADGRVVPLLRDQLARHGLDPRLISCELTETALTGESPEVEAAVAAMREAGVGIALDDFGTGYASLRYVRRFDFDTLKLDRSFVAGLGFDSDDTALVAAAIAMGKALNMTVVAEGVETRDQARRLEAMGCELAQGFLYARPLDAEAFWRMLNGDGPRPALLNVPVPRELGDAGMRHGHA